MGIDDINTYYDIDLKKSRLSELFKHKEFSFSKVDINDIYGLQNISNTFGPFKHIVHLAGHAGVRYSIEDPMAFIERNIVGHANILELCRHTKGFEHLVYASSSSVYGDSEESPLSMDHKITEPVSLYAATKASDEIISHTYSHIYGIPQTGVRYFTVYGPYGRPDMAIYLFTNAIMNDSPIDVFNHGKMWRDFSYIDDIVSGTLLALDNPPHEQDTKHRVFNLGSGEATSLMDVIEIIENNIGKKAAKNFMDMQQGDVVTTLADISETSGVLGYCPKTMIDEGIPKFIDWFVKYTHDE